MKKIILVLSFILFMIFGLGVERVVAGNPCGMNPCSMNPCSANPCSTSSASGSTLIRPDVMTDMDEVKSYGEKLWTDASLGRSGLSCSSCHTGGEGLKAGGWPKKIKMAGDILTLDQMINYCMTNPMSTKALMWNSRKMTALAHYVSTHSNSPQSVKSVNPCSVNPCSMNPCSGR